MSEKISQFFNKRHSLPHTEGVKPNNRNVKLLKHFRKKQDIRLGLVEAVYQRPVPTAESLTPDEMAAVFAMLSCTYPMEAVLQIAERFSNDGWGEQFDEEFFTALENCSLDLKRCGFTKVSRDLTKIGEVTARMHLNSDRAERFSAKINSGLSQSIRDQPFLKQTGW